jgi:hypothetical protein
MKVLFAIAAFMALAAPAFAKDDKDEKTKKIEKCYEDLPPQTNASTAIELCGAL